MINSFLIFGLYIVWICALCLVLKGLCLLFVYLFFFFSFLFFWKEQVCLSLKIKFLVFCLSSFLGGVEAPVLNVPPVLGSAWKFLNNFSDPQR